MNAVDERPEPATIPGSLPEQPSPSDRPNSNFPSSRLSLYVSFWILAIVLVPTCAFLYALPLAPVIWFGAMVGGTATISHGETLGLIVLATSFALALVTVGLLWQRTRQVGREMQ